MEAYLNSLDEMCRVGFICWSEAPTRSFMHITYRLVYQSGVFIDFLIHTLDQISLTRSFHAAAMKNGNSANTHRNHERS